jgi:transposase
MTQRPYKTGASREQVQLLPARIEDYVDAVNPVRAIEAYVASLDLDELGFRRVSGGGPGQPAYDPADLLKLYLYGYINQVRSSRRLERETARNVEVMWLLRGLRPGYRTIAEFRKSNPGALKAANRAFVMLARELDLIGGTLVAIDGAFFHGDASKASIKTRKRLERDLAAINADVEAYAQALEANDAREQSGNKGCGTDASAGDGNGNGNGGSGTVAEQIAALKAKRAHIEAGIERLERRGETQLSTTDKDARLLAKSGQTIAGYNVQCAIDDKHKLIVESEVVNDGNDTGQLHAVAAAAKAALGAETLTVLADAGYFNGATLKACEEDGITAYVPLPDRESRMTADGRFSLQAFAYDAERDAYRCPNGSLLEPSGRKQQRGKTYICYNSKQADCAACPLRARCLSAKGARRTINRWTDEVVLERHRARMLDKDAKGIMRRRSGLAEHPFGTIKCRAGYRHFLVRGFEKVRGEWSLMALCYNFTRVLNIIGLDRLRAHLAAKRTGARLDRPLPPPAARLGRPIAALLALASHIRRIFRPWPDRLVPNCA